MAQLSQAKHWIFTANKALDYVLPEEATLLSELKTCFDSVEMVAISLQLELAPGTGRPHFQGTFSTTTKRRLGWISKRLKNTLLHGLHLEVRRGTQAQARDYSTKADTRLSGPWTLGVWPEKEQGKRTDCEAVIQALSTAPHLSTVRSLLVERPKTLHLLPKMMMAQQIFCVERSSPTTIVWLYGKAGSGKSVAAFELCKLLTNESPYCMGNTKWWSNYSGHLSVLKDNFDPTSMDYDSYCKMGDATPWFVEFKGGNMSFISRFVFITTTWNATDYFEVAKKAKGAQPEEFDRRTLVIKFDRSMRNKPLSILRQLHEQWEDKAGKYGYTHANPFGKYDDLPDLVPAQVDPEPQDWMNDEDDDDVYWDPEPIGPPGP